MPNHYYTSKGERVTSGQIDARVTKAKRSKMESMPFPFCEDCDRSDRGMEMSHTISVKWAKENRKTELCWQQQNIRGRCRKCHDKHDALPNYERINIYYELLQHN